MLMSDPYCRRLAKEKQIDIEITLAGTKLGPSPCGGVCQTECVAVFCETECVAVFCGAKHGSFDINSAKKPLTT